MNYRSGTQIREDFLRFFEGKAHRRVHSSSLVPQNDPTLLFTNAGMNQFKDVFLGAERRDYTRAATSQKCVRAGGKHNDLENVGFTRRHHTFFEMLGNFSFGDYFKREAIAYAWELLTSPDWFGIDKDRLYVTIFQGDEQVPRDDEAERLWIETGVPKDRIFEMSAKDNFWQMGETGPCGPCSEIFYDLGIAASETGEDKPFPEDDQRYVEIWNLVFMQFDRSVTPQTDPDSSVIVLHPLPKPSIDTGMGLERIACVLQGVLSNYQTDLFTPLIARAAELTNFTLPGLQTNPGAPHLASQMWDPKAPAPPPVTESRSSTEPGLSFPTATSSDRVGYRAERDRTPPTPQESLIQAPNPGAPHLASEMWDSTALIEAALSDNKGYASFRIIADHARAATFLINDGVQPANEGRGYVLRKILRRGIRHGRLLGQEKPFMHEMVYAVRDEMQTAYPELAESAGRISKAVLAEEDQFARVLSLGNGYLVYELWTAKRDQVLLALEEFFKQKSIDLQAQKLDLISTGNDLHPNADANRREQSAKLLFDKLGLKESIVDGSVQLLISAIDEASAIVPTLAGARAFRLYETYGLPKDFISDAAKDSGVSFDDEGFELAKEEEQARARASWKGGSQKSANPLYQNLEKTEFEGYSALRADGARVLALVKDGIGVQTLLPEEEGEVILDATAFYADSGGQQGDIGVLYASDHHTPVAEVRGATKPVQGVFAHKVLALQAITVGDEVDTAVNHENRTATERNHTGTHLLHAALREVLGKHVKQAGSLVNQNRLRFDFSHFTGVSEPEMQEIEDIVNRQVLANAHVETLVDVPIDQAIKDLGAMALFGEKYGERVRVVRIGDFSTELCGGTHTRATGEIGLIKLIGESSVSSGVRRLEALTGTGSLSEFRRDHDVARVATQVFGIGNSDEHPAEALRTRLATAEEELKKLRRELDQARMKAASSSVADAAQSAIDVKGIKVLTQRVNGLDKGQMRTLVDTLRTKLGSGIVVLGSTSEDRVSLIAGVTKDLTTRIQAGKIVSTLAPMVGGKGGGRPDLAEAGGTDTAALDATLTKAPEVVSTLLG